MERDKKGNKVEQKPKSKKKRPGSKEKKTEMLLWL